MTINAPTHHVTHEHEEPFVKATLLFSSVTENQIITLDDVNKIVQFLDIAFRFSHFAAIGDDPWKSPRIHRMVINSPGWIEFFSFDKIVRILKEIVQLPNEWKQELRKIEQLELQNKSERLNIERQQFANKIKEQIDELDLARKMEELAQEKMRTRYMYFDICARMTKQANEIGEKYPGTGPHLHNLATHVAQSTAALAKTDMHLDLKDEYVSQNQLPREDVNNLEVIRKLIK